MVRHFVGSVVLFTLFGLFKAQAMDPDKSTLKKKPTPFRTTPPTINKNPEDPFTQGLAFYNKAQYVKAREYFQNALKKGHPEAKGWLGHVENRIGFHFTTRDYRNYAVAKKFFIDALEKGNPAAHYNCGIMLVKGHGTPKDLRGAVSYLEKARELKHLKASAVLAKVYCSLGLESKNINMYEACIWFENARAAGHAKAQKYLGETERIIGYEKEKEEEYDEAREWYQRAIANGDIAAADMLQILESLQKK